MSGDSARKAVRSRRHARRLGEGSQAGRVDDLPRGFLMADRADWPVDQIAKAAWRNYETDLVLLVQQRVCEMVYDYIAVKQRLARTSAG